MTSGRGAICFACQHRRGDKCDAYPKGIPDPIIFGGFDHRQPYGGEATRGGRPILFELEPGRERSLTAYEAVVLELRSLEASSPNEAPARSEATGLSEEERRRRAAERFVWREGDIRWIVPPGAMRKTEEVPGDAAAGRKGTLSLLKKTISKIGSFRPLKASEEASLVEGLERLERMRAKGALSEGEFRKAKRKLLG